jgi:hypothetical protein
MIRRIFIWSVIIIAAACNSTREEPERVAVARAGERILYLDQIPSGLVVQGMSEADSISAVQSYIRRWSRKELMAIKAEANLTPDYKAEVNRQLNEMRNNLLIHQYQQQLLIEKLDTSVTEDELEEYYVDNLSTFTLTTNIVKALFIKLPQTTPDLDIIRRLYRSTDPEDLGELEEKCYMYALRYDDYNDEWISFNQLILEVPLESDEQDRWLQRNRAVELQDDKYVYFVVIRDYKLRNTVAPFEYIRGQVKTIILNKRRNDFLQRLEDDIYNEAIRANTLKVY